MSTREFRLPDLGEGLTESDLVSWHVAAGDTVELNQVIAEVETAKALVDLPSPYAGVVTVLHAEPGQTVNVGEPLVTFEVPDEGEAPGGTPSSGGAAGTRPDGATTAGRSAGSGPAGRAPDGDAEVAEEAPQPNLVGYGARPERSGRPARRARRAPARAAIENGRTGVEGPVGTPTSPISTDEPAPGQRPGTGTGTIAGAGAGAGAGEAVPAERPRSTPPVRRLAKLLGVHLERVVGTGARGLVTREDVLSAVSCAQAGARDGTAAGPEQATGHRTGTGTGAPAGRGAGTGRERNGVHGLPSTATAGPLSRGFVTGDVADRDTAGHDTTGTDGDEAALRTTGRFAPTSLRDILGQSGLARAAARRAGSFPPPDADSTPTAPGHEPGATPSDRGARGDRAAAARPGDGPGATPSGLRADGTPGRRTGDPGTRETRTPVRGVRKHTAAAMVASAFTAPQATVFLTVDVTPSTELLDRLRSHPLARGTRITVLALVARALCVVLPRHPSLASRWEDLPDGSAEIVHSPRVHLGIAVATERGLVVPHVPDAHTLGLTGLAEALADLTATARSGRTAPERLTGGTITITNVGVFGVDAGTPILVPGEAAILGVGAVRRRPWEHEGHVALRDVVTLSLSFDHRVVDGEQGARFLAELGALLADPALALLLAGDPGDPGDPADPDGQAARRTGGAS
ncbi:dihydrolipoamide acetyltransferase family protein [Oerskovia enterophila]|uniref:Dihydrolipoamide acetyltransferase component of pyruvate dehydrogenase complex n=1 Tax=Oerskovia enterophila TaxID=43678 RepID=A0A163SJ78_9CELL|nr:dihydrolipoamide acetyltransferase family protein [Oerskovia enterophila]KZM36480.1 dihydrolipoyllysine-residue acetyltransferase component of pyruvate dehydrogenase complex [Oerskovia enterophila]